VAKVAIVQGSKRYAMVAEDGSFGAKCHGLGSWFVFYQGKVQSVAHNEEILETVWRCNYPDILGEPDPVIAALPVFHKFGVKTRKVSNMVKEYARRQWDIPLVEIEKYGKAGNFGYLTPTAPVNNGTKKVHVVVCFEPHEASELSDFTLSEIAYAWGSAYDKKYDYENLRRWHFDASDIPYVKSYQIQLSQTADTGESISTRDLSLK
jgi:transposase